VPPASPSLSLEQDSDDQMKHKLVSQGGQSSSDGQSVMVDDIVTARFIDNIWYLDE
jgi:hypothetical protein